MDAADKFDSLRASEYQAQIRIALAGYDACHELATCMLAASLGSGSPAALTCSEVIGVRDLSAVNWPSSSKSGI
jgi:hypothetical protein